MGENEQTEPLGRIDRKGRERPVNSTKWELFNNRIHRRLRRLRCRVFGHRWITTDVLVAWMELDGSKNWVSGTTTECRRCWLVSAGGLRVADRTLKRIYIAGSGVELARLELVYAVEDDLPVVSIISGRSNVIHDIYAHMPSVGPAQFAGEGDK